MVFGLYHSPSRFEGLGSPPRGACIPPLPRGSLDQYRGFDSPNQGNRLKVFLENLAKTGVITIYSLMSDLRFDYPPDEFCVGEWCEQ